MTCFNKPIGSYGENISANYLKNENYKILEINYRNKFGEIDIIAMLHNLIIFFEIKSRYTNSFGTPLESVTYFKQKQIIKLSELYIIKNKLQHYNVRYDVIEVFFNNKNNVHTINHFKDAFRNY